MPNNHDDQSTPITGQALSDDKSRDINFPTYAFTLHTYHQPRQRHPKKKKTTTTNLSLLPPPPDNPPRTPHRTMPDQASLNQLLQWSLDHSTTTTTAPTSPPRGPPPAALAQLLGAPSDADRMRACMTVILAEAVADEPSAATRTAWDDLEQLVEHLDNARYLTSLGLWGTLVGALGGGAGGRDAEGRRSAAAVIGAAVQNDAPGQEALCAHDGVAALARRVLDDAEDAAVRRKAVTALSSAVRNFPRALEELARWAPEGVWDGRGVDAAEMDQVDGLMQRLRDYAARGG